MEQWTRRLDLGAIGKEHGTPLHVVNPARIEESFDAYLALVGAPERIVFPVKANPAMAVLRVLARRAACALVASSQEFYLARLADFEPERIHYYSPALDLRRARGVFAEGGSVTLDSAEDLSRLAEAVAPAEVGKRLSLRIASSLPLDPETAARINLPAHSNVGAGKFGVAADRVVAALQASPLPVSGLHFHPGPQIDDLGVFTGALDVLHGLIDRIHAETGHRIRRLNLGGGLGIPFDDGRLFPSIADYAAALAPNLREGLDYLVEPGRSLVGDAAAILTRVECVKQSDGRTWGIVDMGSRDLDRIAMSRLPHQIVRADRTPLPLDGPDTLCGPLCFADDTLLRKTSLEGVAPGDYLLIQHCGAYCYTVARQFDGRFMQGAVSLEPDGALVRTAITEDEVLNPTYSTFLWDSDARAWPATEVVDPGLVKTLNSRYLQYLSMEDSYEIVETRQTSDNSFEIDLDVRSPVDFISLPFCIRMVADLAIMAALKRLGVEKKDFPVWGDRVFLDASVNMEPNRIVPLRLSFSPFAGKGTGKVTNVRFAMDGGRFSGFLRLKFDTAAKYE